jgi:hypothetical protein
MALRTRNLGRVDLAHMDETCDSWSSADALQHPSGGRFSPSCGIAADFHLSCFVGPGFAVVRT